MTNDSGATWSAVLRSEDAVAGDVVPVRMHDSELAIWRTAAGQLEAWEDRCPHRGTRLTLGTNTGTEVICRYHGWRFAAGSGACTRIPAHPTQTPPKNAVVRTYRCVERYGLVWVSRDNTNEVPHIRTLDAAGPSFTMRSAMFNANLESTARALIDTQGAERLVSSGGAALLATDALAATVPYERQPISIIYVLCAQDATRTTVHGIVRSAAAGTQRLNILRALNERMKSLKRGMRFDAVAVG